jgi:exopolysaccharide production protein ExoQ
MPPALALLVFGLGILCLFALDEDNRLSASWALWLPVAWLLIAGSRHVSTWLNMAPAVSADQYLEGSPIDRLIYAALVAAGAMVLYRRRKLVGNILRQNWPLLLFVLYCLISVTWSDFPGVALKRWIKSLGDYIVVLIILTEQNRSRAIKRVFARVGFVLLPISILLIKYYPAWGRAYASHWDGTQFYVGVGDTKNMLGMTCMVFGFAAFWHVLHMGKDARQRRRRAYLVHGSTVAMAIWLLHISNSKTSLMCFVAAASVISLHRFLKFARNKIILHVLVSTVVFGIVSVLFLGVGAGLLQSIGRDSTLTGRTDIWRAVLAVPIDPIVGTGFESFWLGDRLNQIWANPELFRINEAHNGYLEVYLNFGFVGVILIAILLIAAYRNVVRSIRRDPELGRLRLGFFIMAVTYNFTEAAIRSTDLVWIAFLIVLIAIPEKVRLRQSLANDDGELRARVEKNQIEVSATRTKAAPVSTANYRFQAKIDHVSYS